MANVKKTIGKVPVWIEEYKSGSTYSKFNIVGMYGSSYISLIDNNTTPPATIGEDGNITVDTEKWGIIADASKYYTFVDKKQDKLTAGNGIEINGENVISVTLDTTVFFVAEVLPESPTDEQKKKICLVPSTETEAQNEYTEYVWVVDDEHPSGYWEEMGKFKANIDLTPYQKKTDDTLHTTDKTVVGAINEVSDALGYKGTVSPIDVPISQDGKYINVRGEINSLSAYGIYSPFQIKKGQAIYGKVGTTINISIISQIDNTGNWIQALVIGTVSGQQDIFFVAPYDMTIAICCTKATFNNLKLATIDSFAALQDNGFALGMRKIYESYGAVYNEETGYYELNGLTDISEEEMYEIYKCCNGIVNNPDMYMYFAYTPIRTTLITQCNLTYRGLNKENSMNGVCINASKIEVFKITNDKDVWGTTFHNAFNGCASLKRIENILAPTYGTSGSTSPFSSTFSKCAKLSYVKIKGLKSKIEFPDSPLLSYESLNYLVTNAANTDAITVTVHATTYAYLTGTEQPTPKVGGTTEEWQALVTAAQEKQISFATA